MGTLNVARKGLILSTAIALLMSSACANLRPRSRIAICGTREHDAVILSTELISESDHLVVSGLTELVTLPPGARCPHQWQPANYDPTNSRVSNGRQEWFIVRASDSELGGTVFRLDWQDAQFEEWFQLPKGDFILDAIWSETQEWQALVVGGRPDCADIPRGNEYNRIRCAQRNGAFYLVDDSGHYAQLLEANGTGRCYGVFNSQASHVAFVESEQCFAYEGESSRIVVLDLRGRELRILSDGNAGGRPLWSPDGRVIAFETNVEVGTTETSPSVTLMSRKVRVAEVGDGSVRVLRSAVGGKPDRDCRIATSPNAWSPDGRKLLCSCSVWQGGHGTEILVILDVSKGSVTEVDTSVNNFDHWMGAAWIDSDMVMWKVVGSESRTRFNFLDLRSGEVRGLPVEPSYNWTWLRRSPDGNVLALLRTAEHRSYIDLFVWHNLAITKTIELPQGVNWVDFYWIAE